MTAQAQRTLAQTALPNRIAASGGRIFIRVHRIGRLRRCRRLPAVPAAAILRIIADRLHWIR